LKGADALGMVLINTLRRDGPRLKWIGDALVRAAEVGGLDLFRDLFLPLLMNEDWLEINRSNFLKPKAAYTALPTESGHFKLLAQAGREADWDLPYERLDLPVLIVTGLQDHVFLEEDVVNDLFSRLPNGWRVDIPDAGHLIPAERPDALVDSLLSFIKEVS
jgi:pimeloyl-ACP methyl ester carboxylesterase